MMKLFVTSVGRGLYPGLLPSEEREEGEGGGGQGVIIIVKIVRKKKEKIQQNFTEN